jgi:hypothetical protein
MPTRRVRRPLWRRLLLGLVALVVAGVAVLVGIRLGSGDQDAATPAPSPSATPTPVRDVDLTGMPIPRGPVCPLLDEKAVAHALGGRVVRTSQYGNGDRAELVPGVRDVAHEYSCSYQAADGALARIWVFAAPVDKAGARSLVREVVHAEGCREVPSRPAFGAPSVTTACPAPDGPGTAITMHGLFDDAWFSCELARPRPAGSTPAQVRRTERWCVRVAETLGSATS